MLKNKEQKFYSALENLFVGAKLEGQSGYVNCLRSTQISSYGKTLHIPRTLA